MKEVRNIEGDINKFQVKKFLTKINCKNSLRLTLYEKEKMTYKEIGVEKL